MRASMNSAIEVIEFGHLQNGDIFSRDGDHAAVHGLDHSKTVSSGMQQL
jgi:hypothetical protein